MNQPALQTTTREGSQRIYTLPIGASSAKAIGTDRRWTNRQCRQDIRGLARRNPPASLAFLGAIVGLITWGIVGLVLGPVVIAVRYQIFLKWLNYEEANTAKYNSGEGL
jgi:hypothetical protein